MPGTGGLEATRELCRAQHPPRVIVLTTFDPDDYVVDALATGADGFLLKDTPPADVVAAIRKVAQGETMLSPAATSSLVRRLRTRTRQDRAAEAQTRLAARTERELEVATAVGQGLSNAEIAARPPPNADHQDTRLPPLRQAASDQPRPDRNLRPRRRQHLSLHKPRLGETAPR